MTEIETVPQSQQVHLHNHSEGSFLDGFAKVEQMARRARELGQSALSINDHGEVNQHFAFQKACLAEGIKPILGMEGYWAPDIPAIRAACQGKGNAGKWGSMMSHICLQASSDEGLRNLWALSSTAYDETHFYHRPVADPALLRQYSAGLYASDGCLMTAFGQAVEAGDEMAARQYLGGLRDIYRERFYVELHTWQYMHPSTDDKVKWSGEWISTTAANAKMTTLNAAKVRLATEMGIPMVVVNDAHHAYPEHWKLKEMIWGYKADANPDQMEGSGQKADHIMGDDELYFWMDRHGVSRDVVGEAIKYSSVIAENCNTEIKPMLKMPTFTQSEADDYALFLDHVEAGFKRRCESRGLDESRYRPRLESEIKLIADKHFAGYFLVVEDVIDAARTGRWAEWVTKSRKREPMDVGPGRGSAGGSLVAYALGITNLDPIKYGLLFERFLTPERVGFPDIDIDFPKNKRSGIKEYTQRKYGEGHVCSICTMSSNKAKGTVNDLVRALGIDHQDGVEISKLIEEVVLSEVADDSAESSDDAALTWEEIADLGRSKLSPWIRKHPELFRNLKDLIGVKRQTGVHPAAVLISERPLYEVIPTRRKNDTLTTAFDMYDIEELGGLKMDYLALRHLDALAEARDLVRERHSVELDYDAFDAEYADPAIWTSIEEGQTTGIFQLGTPGGTDSAIEFKPRDERDVAALIAINRPGVRDAGFYDIYLRRRAGVQPVEFDHPLMAEIVGDTYGILIYQEQLMEAAKTLANFTLIEADALRKAVSKKVMEKVMAMKNKFRDGCLANPAFIGFFGDVNPIVKASPVIERVWGSIEASGRYLFNKSHAQGYSLITCTEVWMKHHYPVEMLTGFMRVEENREKINPFVRDARRRKIEILPPDINVSGKSFTAVGDNSIRYGLVSVMGIAERSANPLIRNQPYKNVEDLIARANPNKTAILNLAKLGALDCFGDRVQVMREIEWYRATEGLASTTMGDFDKLTDTVSRRLVEGQDYQVEIPDFADPLVVYNIEQELVGSFVTIDPMGPYLEVIERESVRNPAAIRAYMPGQKLVVGGQLVKIHEHTIAKGRTAGAVMAFLGVDWQGDLFDVVAFPETYWKYKYLLKIGAPMLLGCERTDRGISLVELFRLDLIGDQHADQG